MSVHSEALGVTLDGNIITRHNVPGDHLHILAAMYGQISVIYDQGNISVSCPMSEADRREFAGLIHRQNHENKLKKGVDKGKPQPDNDGPGKPTPPRGGAGQQVEFENTGNCLLNNSGEKT